METLQISVEVIGFLFMAAAIAGFLDTLAGGGGLITLPALIISGIPPLYALGTNKLQGTVGTFTASMMMFRKKKVAWRQVKYPMLLAFLGSAAGTLAVQFVDATILGFVIPVVLIGTAAYFLLSPLFESAEKTAKISEKLYASTVVPLIGWYDGMFGPGTGSFFVFAGSSLRGHGLIESTMIAKTLNFATNSASLLVFLLAGKLVLTAGLVMMVGQFLGAWLGSHCLMKINPVYLRGIVVVMCVGMLVKYFLG